MNNSKNTISRRDLLDRALRAGLALSSAGTLMPIADCSMIPSSTVIPHHSIDQSLCSGCGRCTDLCPMDAIITRKKSSINPDECVECGVCSRSRVCPVSAIREGRLQWPRMLREIFSNPLVKHESTGIRGRGTAGLKTNDSQNRYRRGDIGVFIELGRPAMGARFSDVEIVVKKFKSAGYDVIADNPVHALIANRSTGALIPDIIHEKVISCLVEFIIPEKKGGTLLRLVKELALKVRTVFTVSVVIRADDDGRSGFKRVFPGARCLPQVKVNIGLARNIKGDLK